jgi:PIN domain nuclease of toxin-antitoxin system
VRILLDTHIFLWLNTEPERLGAQLATIEDPRTELVVSAASSWEIAIKYGLGRLPLPEPPERYVPERIHALAAEGLPIAHNHALAVAGLPQLHRDPFDRLLVAQATLLDLAIMTADAEVAQYPMRSLVVGR